MVGCGLAGAKPRLLQRFTRTYDHLRQQPRPVRRRLQRQWGASLAGAALALALLNAPAHAVPIGITVDGTTCTLVDAISAANSDTAVGGCAAGSGADTITLQTDVTLDASNNNSYNDTGLPVISSAITIEGAGHTIQRTANAPAFRLLAVAPSGNLTLHQTTLSGGYTATYGGGIYNKGTVTVSNSTLSGNTATANYGGGGGIFNQGTVTVSNSTLSGNTATKGGGGIYNQGTLDVSNSTLSGNTASGTRGGGIYNTGTLNVSNSTLSGNTASFTGGGIYNKATVTVSNSTLSGNTAGGGGGIYNRNGGTMTVSSSTLSGNTASNGGGIYNTGTLTLARSLISGNSGGSAAEIYNDPNATVNAANFNLIGHDSDAGSVNFTPSGSDIVPSQALAAILNPTLADNGGDTLTHALVTGSPALDAAGDSGLDTDQRGITRPQGAADDIGAFELEPAAAPVNARLNSTDCNLIDAIIAANTDTATGACAAGTAGADTITLLDDVTLTASNNYSYYSDTGLPVISSEITIEGAGNTIQRDAGAPAFRLLAVSAAGNLTLHQTTLSGGIGGGILSDGGAIYNYGGTVTVSNSTLSGNTAGDGGGIYNSDGTVTVSNSTLSGNTADYSGGGIYNEDGTVTVSNSTLSGNTASNSGGGIYNSFGTVTVSNSTLSGNTADYSGGGIYNDRGTMTVSNSTLSGNTADDKGGGIYHDGGTVTVSNSTLSGNTASRRQRRRHLPRWWHGDRQQQHPLRQYRQWQRRRHLQL